MMNENILQQLSQVNMTLKVKIDSFRRLHMKRMTEIKEKLGIKATMQQFEAIVKSKQGDREFKAAKEHKDYVDKTEGLNKVNKEIEEKVNKLKDQIEDDVNEKRRLQEKFSQDYFILQRKIEKLREDIKVSE